MSSYFASELLVNPPDTCVVFDTASEPVVLLSSLLSEVGLALVRYYRMFLHIFNLFINKTRSTGDKMDYGQR